MEVQRPLLMGVINVTLACRDSMRDAGGGVVLNISSMAGYMSATPYAVSKLTVRGLTVAFATELVTADQLEVTVEPFVKIIEMVCALESVTYHRPETCAHGVANEILLTPASIEAANIAGQSREYILPPSK